MSLSKYVLQIVIVCMALYCLQHVAVATVAANEYTSVYTGTVDNGSINTYEGCFVRLDLAADSPGAHLTVSSPNYPQQMVTISPGNSYYYYNVIKVYVSEINKTSGKIWVDIAKYTGGSPTPAVSGTKLTCDTPGLQALAGDIVTFPITIQNNNDEDKTYTLSASSGTGWALRFVSGDKGLYKLYVPRMSSKTVNLEVRTTGATGIGEKKITASVDSQSIDVYVQITSVNQSADVTATVSSKIASIGDKITYDIRIKNLQTQENIYRLSASGLPENWYYRFKESAAAPKSWPRP